MRLSPPAVPQRHAQRQGCPRRRLGLAASGDARQRRGGKPPAGLGCSGRWNLGAVVMIGCENLNCWPNSARSADAPNPTPLHVGCALDTQLCGTIHLHRRQSNHKHQPTDAASLTWRQTGDIEPTSRDLWVVAVALLPGIAAGTCLTASHDCDGRIQRCWARFQACSCACEAQHEAQPLGSVHTGVHDAASGRWLRITSGSGRSSAADAIW